MTSSYLLRHAQANRDAGIREAECEKAAMDVKYNTDTKIEDNSRAFKLQKANFDKEVNTAVSHSDNITRFFSLFLIASIKTRENDLVHFPPIPREGIFSFLS